jgi:hypothetical protein
MWTSLLGAALAATQAGGSIGPAFPLGDQGLGFSVQAAAYFPLDALDGRLAPGFQLGLQHSGRDISLQLPDREEPLPMSSRLDQLGGGPALLLRPRALDEKAGPFGLIVAQVVQSHARSRVESATGWHQDSNSAPGLVLGLGVDGRIGQTRVAGALHLSWSAVDTRLTGKTQLLSLSPTFGLFHVF